jgi:hypothetical protein
MQSIRNVGWLTDLLDREGMPQNVASPDAVVYLAVNKVSVPG